MSSFFTVFLISGLPLPSLFCVYTTITVTVTNCIPPTSQLQNSYRSYFSPLSSDEQKIFSLTLSALIVLSGRYGWRKHIAVCWQPYYSKGCAPGNVCPQVGHYYPSVQRLDMFIRLSTVWTLLSVCRLDIFNLSGMLNCGTVARDYCQDELSLLAAMFIV